MFFDETIVQGGKAMGILAHYDITGIQNYIFATDNLRENHGADKLAGSIFGGDDDSGTQGILQRTLLEVLRNSSYTKWQNGGALQPGKYDAEIIQSRGGHALVAFYDKGEKKAAELFQTFTSAFLTRVLDECGRVGIATAAVETAFGTDYQADHEKLKKRLEAAKGFNNIPAFAGNQAITRQSILSGLPAVEYTSKYGENEWLDSDQILKREAGEPHKFDDLVLLGDSFIGVIHVDGNNMGRQIGDKLRKCENYAEAVEENRKLSNALGKAVKNVIDGSQSHFETYFAKTGLSKKIPYFKFINAGDDITVLTSGRYALSVAADILRLFNGQKSPFDKQESSAGDKNNLSASAGVVIFHHHYPFSDAYKLAEECCASAKKPTRIEPNAGKSYIDFVLLQGGAIVDLGELHKRQYTVGGKPITRRKSGQWQVGGNEPINFEWFERQQREWVTHESDTEKEREKKWPRGKQKALREAIASGDGSAELILDQMRSRGKYLPNELYKGEGKKELLEDWQQIIFDLLEVADVFESIEVTGNEDYR
jgi:hypothetical protein